ncbi:hypothetical protein XA68_12186 [Ophiocordyceps unilateralis]|uniref:Alpha/beta hydrolase fold-3 domain-containing protein n=1 Tax=Ophiocordyceps unilateralis TaxID=268505 RepID=A0A2A9PEB1_OPHUN|nr:hypothetical protein XA68_12186 [Ophiocordyceps unilateralis]
MKRLSTTSVSLAVTPTALSTFISHFLRRKPLRERPTAHLSYDEGLHLIRSFLDFASRHTVEELQAFTSQWVPHPQWVRVEAVTVPDALLERAADLLIRQLGDDGIHQVGGRKWWQWRGPETTDLGAEWIEMRDDADERQRSGGDGPGQRRVMLYFHGGAYFFGGVDEHRYQLQRHARKLKARVLAPSYRLAPQFPFPCGLHDCLATYLLLLESCDASAVVLAGDSAGGGLVLSVLCLLRDQGLPLPAGAVLVSPWVDLTHSFPSVAADAPLDYIPQAGFHYKPSRAWPPPNNDDMVMLRAEAEAASRKKKDDDGHAGASVDPAELRAKQNPPVALRDSDEPPPAPEPGGHQSTSGGLHTDTETFLTVTATDGERVTIRDQIQMYTTNSLLSHPLVSPVMQPTLGGLPPLLILVGGGELLRDEQIHLAHKCANPERYAPDPKRLTDRGRELLAKYKPTDVQLQVWDDLCHVPPTLSFTRPAKYMYRSIAQFGAWALARAQKMGIDILDDESISVITSTESESDEDATEGAAQKNQSPQSGRVGRAGDPLPSFRKHMIRQRVTRHGVIMPLDPESELPGCCVEAAEVGVIKEGPVMKWLAMKKQWDAKFPAAKAKVHKQMVQDMVIGFQDFGPGEHPPPSALAGRRRRRRAASDPAQRKRTKGVGLALWSLWGSKHDEATVEREKRAELVPLPDLKAVMDEGGSGPVCYGDAASLQPASSTSDATCPTPGRSRRRTVVDENQTGSDEPVAVSAPLVSSRHHDLPSSADLLSANYVPQTGVTGKRPQLGGIAMPFSLNKDAETASMLTLHSITSPAPSPAPSAVDPMMDLSDEPGDRNKLDNEVPIGPTQPSKKEEEDGG